MSGTAKRALGLVMTMLVLSSRAGAAELSATDIVKKAYGAESHVTYSGHMRTTLYSGSRATSADVNVWRAGKRSRMEYVSGPSAGSVVIDDGSSVITLRTSSKTAVVSSTPEQPSDVNLLLANYNPIQRGTELVAGRVCYRIEFSPKCGCNPSQKLWIDKHTFVPLKTERYSCDGRLVSQSEYSRISFAQRLNASLFSVPDGWKIVRVSTELETQSTEEMRKAVGFVPKKPGYVPKGYKFDGYSVAQPCPASRFAALRYTNGLNTISVFSGKGCPGMGRGRGRGAGWRGGRQGSCGETCLLARSPNGRMMRKMVGDITVILIGDIAESELQKMANSIR